MDSQQQKPPVTDVVASADPSSDEVRHADGRIEHPRVQHEELDVRFRAIAVAAVVIGAALAAVVGAIRLFVHEEAAMDVRHTEHAGAPRSSALPAQPRLEALEPHARPRSFEADNAAAEARLHGYGPTDDAGYVHVPIEKAIRKLAEDLQSHEPPQRQQKSTGLVGGGDANSGRLLRKASR